MKSCPLIRSGALPILVGVVLAGCGSDGPGAGIDGPFVSLSGARTKTFSLAPGALNVVCKPKPGLKEFEFEAATALGADSGTYFRFTLKEFSGPRDWDIEYDVGKPEHKITVGLPGDSGGPGYRYVFFQHLRTDINQTFRSHCDVTLAAEELTAKTRYSGSMACSMLFADFSSKDNRSSSMLNANVDLTARFECDY